MEGDDTGKNERKMVIRMNYNQVNIIDLFLYKSNEWLDAIFCALFVVLLLRFAQWTMPTFESTFLWATIAGQFIVSSFQIESMFKT